MDKQHKADNKDTSQSQQTEIKTKGIIDYNVSLQKLWIEFGHDPDIKQSENWKSWEVNS